VRLLVSCAASSWEKLSPGRERERERERELY